VFCAKDSQEFLRCFMDHLHEELKQPVIMNEDDENDNNHSNEKTVTEFTPHYVTSNVDCDISEPSDTDYETCDSGLSSESNSVAADVSPRTDNRDDTLVQESDAAEQSTAPVDESSPSPSDVGDAAAESGCSATMCADAEVLSTPIAAVGDSMSKDPCDGSDCGAAQCRQKSEAGAGEVGTVLTKEPQVTFPLASSDSAVSDTTSLMSMLSDSKCARDSDATSQTSETTAALETRHPLIRKSSSPRERQQMERTDKPVRLVRTADDMVQKPCKSLPRPFML